MKISIIGTVGIPAKYGGFETLAERLVDTNEAEFVVYCSGKHYKDRPKNYKSASLVYIPFDANGIFSILYDILSILHALASGHRNLLVLGVSGALIFPILKFFPNIKLITNIDGMEWRRNKWKGIVKSFLRWSEYLAIKFSTCVISDNEAITDYVAKEYQAKCKTIAYGGDHALQSISNIELEKSFDVASPFALSICRIEPENNVHLILEAFTKTKLRIIFVGNWEKSSYGRALYIKYKDNINITLSKPIYCLSSLHALRSSCSFYVHGHSAGGTNPSLVEMMHFAKPIIAFDCSFNRFTMENKGSYFSDLDSLVETLREPNKHSQDNVLADIAKRRYNWNKIRRQYIDLFS